MEEILRVEGLCKRYPQFTLDQVSFSMKPGRIMGLIGRNGAGKTTTMKAILNLVHPDEGTVSYFGKPFPEHESAIKQRIGYAGGAVDFYRKKHIDTLLKITSTFYPNWDEAVCRRYLKLFEIAPDKTASQLSEGMKVKLSLVIALSHHAELLILDEPTSGLDPISRAELLEIFQYLKSQGVAILFSTHITSDLDKCADDITYLREGQVLASEPLVHYLERSAKLGHGTNLEEIMLFHERAGFYERTAD